MAQTTQHRPSVRNRLLAALPPEDWGRLEPRLEAVELPFDQTIYTAGGAVDAVFFVETGMVSLLVALEDGEQVEAGIAGPEGLIGLPLVYGASHSLTARSFSRRVVRDRTDGPAAEGYDADLHLGASPA